MNNQLPRELQRCVDFHGHLCPGLVIGYMAACEALERLQAVRSADEELIAIVENDSCAVDAIQVLTGCTFGKGNLRFQDYGKMVFWLAIRRNGQAVRLSYRHLSPPEIETIPEERRRQYQIEYMLRQPVGELFDIREQTIGPRDAATIHESVVCAICGEKVMATRVREIAGQIMCLPCASKRESEDGRPLKQHAEEVQRGELESFWQ